MAIYKYKVKNRLGNIVDGERSGKSEEEIINALAKEGLTVIKIDKKSSGFKLPFLGGGAAKVSLRDLSVFNRQLSVMFNAGLPITQGIGILATQQKNKGFQQALGEVRRDVEAGANFSNALKKFPKVFNNLYTSLIQAGEASGNLDTILIRLSEYIENSARLTGKVKSAMTYPIAVLLIAIVLTGVILEKVVPVFADLFSELGAALPLPTRIVVGASEFLQAYFWWIILGMIGIVFLFKTYYSTYKGRRVIDKITLKLPVFGDLLLKVAVARVTRTMSTLLNSGVEIIESITITSKTSGNAIIEDSVLKSRNAVQEGKPLYESWEEQKVFPFMVTQMVGVGEQTGSLSTMLGKIADFYDEEVENAVASLISLMEPLMIVVLGSLIGGIVVAMYMPMFEMISNM